MNLIKRLESLRENNNWSKTEVARQLVIPQTTYLTYESGKCEPDIDMLVRIAKLYNVTVDYLIGNDNPKTGYILPKEITTLHEAKTFLDNINIITTRMSDEAIIKYAQSIFFLSTKK